MFDASSAEPAVAIPMIVEEVCEHVFLSKEGLTRWCMDCGKEYKEECDKEGFVSFSYEN